MRIAIDAIAMSSSQPGGYRSYTSNLVGALRQASSANKFYLLVDRPITWDSTPCWQLCVLSRQGSLGFVWREQVTVPRWATENGVDVLHAPAATAALYGHLPFVLTIYDTIEFSEPLPSPRNVKRWVMRVYSRLVQKRAALLARRILTISEYSRSRIAELLSISPDRIAAIPLASAAIYQTLPHGFSLVQAHQRFGVSDHILAIASAAARKNTGRLLDAYARLPLQVREAHPLTLVCTHEGVRTHLSSTVASLGLQRQIVFIEDASDEDLLILYNSAAVFVFPSLEEGFGLPPLEAMACGTPVVASNTSSLPEVLGDAALLVTPTDTPALSAAIASILRDPALAEDLRARGLARSQQFSWHDTARATLAVYEQAAAGRDA